MHFIMDFKEYQKKAHETAQYPVDIQLFHNNNITTMGWIYPIIGLQAEVGELSNQLKKVIRDDNGVIKDERMLEIKDELGDILWYISELCTSLGLELNGIAKMNINKLSLRARNNLIHGDKRK